MNLVLDSPWFQKTAQMAMTAALDMARTDTDESSTTGSKYTWWGHTDGRASVRET